MSSFQPPRVPGISIIVPDDALLSDVAHAAAAQHLHIISNGLRTVLSPTIPHGWTKLTVRVKTPTFARLD